MSHRRWRWRKPEENVKFNDDWDEALRRNDRRLLISLWLLFFAAGWLLLRLLEFVWLD